MLLERNVEAFRRAGYREVERAAPLDVLLEGPPGATRVRARMAPQGRIFGGSYALEVTTAEPVLPRTQGVSARPRGAVRLTRIAFRGRRGDEEGGTLARRLEEHEALREALRKVHFERIAVEPDGRPVIRHMGGSVVWMLFPPLVRPVPLVDEQARAALDALETFARIG